MGLFSWLLGYWILVIKVLFNWKWADKNDKENAHIHLASFLSLISVAFAMLSDNVVVYSFVMSPSGIMLGAAFGSDYHRKKVIRSYRKLVGSRTSYTQLVVQE